MTNLLTHSMSEFSEMILHALELAGARDIVEIGAEFDGMSAVLADYCGPHGGHLTSIEPSPKSQFSDWVKTKPHVRHVAKTSLETFAELKGIDAWLVDGDHNWYTVCHELLQIEAICRRDSKPVLVFLHDTAWPCARRDTYAAPEKIPAEYRQPYSYKGGVTPGNPGVIDDRGFRGMGNFAVATTEGGACNGVLTAIEDFMTTAYKNGREYGFAEIPGMFGLGVLFDLDAPWSKALAEFLLPYHQNKLLHRLEEHRVRSSLQVIKMQDELASQPAKSAAYPR